MALQANKVCQATKLSFGQSAPKPEALQANQMQANQRLQATKLSIGQSAPLIFQGTNQRLHANQPHL